VHKFLLIIATCFLIFSLLPGSLATVADEMNLDNTPREYDGYQQGVRGKQPKLFFPLEYIRDYQCLVVGPGDSREVYLTLDVGEEGYVREILDLLAQEQVPAAFFITGSFITEFPDLVIRMYSEGHVIGNHTMSHQLLPSHQGPRELWEELIGVDQLLLELGIKPNPFMRPPQGIYSQRTLALSHNWGYINVFWSLTYADGDLTNQPTPQVLTASILEQIHPGAIIMLHSFSPATRDALPGIIQEISQEYTFASLSKFLHERESRP